MSKAQRNINILMMLLFSAYAIYAVLYQHSSIFFIVYLFWFDELIRNCSILVQIKMHNEDPQLAQQFNKEQAFSTIKSRFFFLFVYAIFIVLVFGIFFHLRKESTNELITNIKIIMFRDLAFNVCLMIAIIREIIQINEVRKNRSIKLPPFSAMNGHLLTLHLSIILGGFMWFLTNGKFKEFSIDLGSLNQYAVILPFFIIKFLVDFYQLKNIGKNYPTLLSSLQQ